MPEARPPGCGRREPTGLRPHRRIAGKARHRRDERPRWRGGTSRGDPFTCDRRQLENACGVDNRCGPPRCRCKASSADAQQDFPRSQTVGHGSTMRDGAGFWAFVRRPRNMDGRIARVFSPASQRYVVLRPWANRIRSASEIPVPPDEMMRVTSAYGTVKVVIRIARFKLIVYPTLKKVAVKP